MARSKKSVKSTTKQKAKKKAKKSKARKASGKSVAPKVMKKNIAKSTNKSAAGMLNKKSATRKKKNILKKQKVMKDSVVQSKDCPTVRNTTKKSIISKKASMPVTRKQAKVAPKKKKSLSKESGKSKGSVVIKKPSAQVTKGNDESIQNIKKKKRKRNVPTVAIPSKKKRAKNTVGVKKSEQEIVKKQIDGKITNGNVQPKRRQKSQKEFQNDVINNKNITRLEVDLSNERMKMKDVLEEESKKFEKKVGLSNEVLKKLKGQVVELNDTLQEKENVLSIKKKEIKKICEDEKKGKSKQDYAYKTMQDQLNRYLLEVSDTKETQRQQDIEHKTRRSFIEDSLIAIKSDNDKFFVGLSCKLRDAENAHYKCQVALDKIQNSFVAVQQDLEVSAEKYNISQQKVKSLEDELKGVLREKIQLESEMNLMDMAGQEGQHEA